MMPIDNKEKFYTELDDLREDEIRARLGKGVWAANKERLAQLYLEEKARARAKAAEPEVMRIARSAKTRRLGSKRHRVLRPHRGIRCAIFKLVMMGRSHAISCSSESARQGYKQHLTGSITAPLI
jgi:hypothetical protein